MITRMLAPAELKKLAKEEYCYLTSKGRVTGRPHQNEIWFGLESATAYLLSGGQHRSDWVKNLKADPHVELRIGKHTFHALARVVTDPAEDASARRLLAAKYYNWRPGRRLNTWARTALPVAFDLQLK